MTSTPEVQREFLAERLGWHPFEVMQGCRYNVSNLLADDAEMEAGKVPVPSLPALVEQTEAQLSSSQEPINRQLWKRYQKALELHPEYTLPIHMFPRRVRAEVLYDLLRNHADRYNLTAHIRYYRRCVRGLDTPRGRIDPVYAAGALYALRETAQDEAYRKRPVTRTRLFNYDRLIFPPRLHIIGSPDPNIELEDDD